MRKKYIYPDAELIKFNLADVLVSSTTTPTTLPKDEEDIPIVGPGEPIDPGVVPPRS